MPVPQITITPAGFAAIVNAENTGTAPVKLTHVGLTAQHFDVATLGATVPGEAKRLTTFGGKAVADDTLHLNVRDDSADTYTLRGFGLYLQDGTLFAVYSQATPIMEKAAAATLLLATDIRFAKITATSIEVGDIDFINPPASTTQMGVVRLATEQEADTGSDHTTAITPRGLAGYINSRFGDGAPSIFVKKLLSVATAAIFRAELGLKSAAVRDEGAGNGLDADKLDGAHGDYYLDWRNFVGLPSSFPPAQHGHLISEVAGLADELARKTNRTGDTFTGTLAVNGAALRSYGWNGIASNGVLMLGDTGSFIQKNGAYFDFTNSAGGYSATLSAGGAIWTSGNFDPAAKLSRAGDTMTGALSVHAEFKAGINATGAGLRTAYDGSGNVYLDARQNLSQDVRNGNMHLRAATIVNSALQVRTDFGAVGNTLYAGGIIQRLTANTGNDDKLDTQVYRSTAGNGWDKAAWRFGRVVDLDTISFVQFEGNSTINIVTGKGSGNFGFGNNGAITCNGGYDFGSSIKLKDIEGPVPYGLATVEHMELAAGRYKPEYNSDGRRRLFFVAEQLAELVPEAVDLEGVEFNGERVASIKLDQLLPVMAKAIQELAAEVRALREDG